MMTDDTTVKYDGALTDIYSFGVIMWATMASEKPYQVLVREARLNLWQLRGRVIGGTRPALDVGEMQYAPADAIELVKECWAGVPLERPASFDVIRQRLGPIQSTAECETNPMVRTHMGDDIARGTLQANALDQESDIFSGTNPMLQQAV